MKRLREMNEHERAEFWRTVTGVSLQVAGMGLMGVVWWIVWDILKLYIASHGA